jgi:hypothetical protein
MKRSASAKSRIIGILTEIAARGARDRVCRRYAHQRDHLLPLDGQVRRPGGERRHVIAPARGGEYQAEAVPRESRIWPTPRSKTLSQKLVTPTVRRRALVVRYTKHLREPKCLEARDISRICAAFGSNMPENCDTVQPILLFSWVCLVRHTFSVLAEKGGFGEPPLGTGSVVQ